MAHRPAGSGTIRKKTVTRNGKEYTYWEARYTEGIDPGTGKQIQRSITGKTQKEVARRLKEATLQIDNGTYTAPDRMTVSEWLETWLRVYVVKQKPLTKEKYTQDIKHHILPHLGAVKLQNLTVDMVQEFYNGLDLAPKTVRNIHGVLSKSINQAVKLGYCAKNPCSLCELPADEKHKNIHALNRQQLVAYVHAARNDSLGDLFITMLFTGMRRGEIIGLTWDCVDFEAGAITVRQQLQLQHGKWDLSPTKSSNIRRLIPPPMVMDSLRAEKRRQQQWEKENAEVFSNPYGFVFTSPTGHYRDPNTLFRHNCYILDAAGLPHIRIHDLRHSFAVTSLQAGDDIKTLQSNLGHADASFTLNVYAHVLDEMKAASSARLQSFYDDAEETQNKPHKGKHKGKQKTG